MSPEPAVPRRVLPRTKGTAPHGQANDLTDASAVIPGAAYSAPMPSVGAPAHRWHSVMPRKPAF